MWDVHEKILDLHSLYISINLFVKDKQFRGEPSNRLLISGRPHASFLLCSEIINWNTHERTSMNIIHCRMINITFLGFDLDCFYKQVFLCYGVWTTQKDDKPISAGSALTWETDYFSLQACMETDEIIEQLGKLNGHNAFALQRCYDFHRLVGYG